MGMWNEFAKELRPRRGGLFLFVLPRLSGRGRSHRSAVIERGVRERRRQLQDAVERHMIRYIGDFPPFFLIMFGVVATFIVVVLVMVVLPVLWALILSFQRIRLLQIRRLDVLGGLLDLHRRRLSLWPLSRVASFETTPGSQAATSAGGDIRPARCPSVGPGVASGHGGRGHRLADGW